MERSSSNVDRVPPNRGTGHIGHRVFRWLGFSRATSQREENDAVSNGGQKASGSQANGGHPGEAAKSDDPAKIFRKALEEHRRDTEGEAGRTEGRIFPEFVVGAQAYPDPRMWIPTNADPNVPLSRDENYVRVSKILDRIDREDGFDGRQ